MEYENKYASKNVAGAGLGLGIAGTALGLLAGGLGGVGLGNVPATAAAVQTATSACAEDHYVNRYEAEQAARIANLETEVKLRDANTYTDQKLLELYKYTDGRLRDVEAQICQQNVYNATNTATLNCMAGQIAQLQSLTKIVIPNGSVCPGWGEATVTVSTGTTAA